MNKLYTVYDSKVEAYMKPFFLRNKGEALRSWIEICNDPQSQMFKYPSDFTLFEIGEFDENTGKVTPHKTPTSVAMAIDVKKETMIKDPKDNILNNPDPRKTIDFAKQQLKGEH